jgi:hypothetical protein
LAACDLTARRPVGWSRANLVRPDGEWNTAETKARLRDPFGTLAHHPMVLHRGGDPDGS